MEKNNTFQYTYSAEEQGEILAIQKKYSSEKKSLGTLEELRQLDKSTTRPAMIVSVSVGIIGTLIMGTGMSLVTTLHDFFVLGVMIGVIGIALIALAFPLYKKILEKQKKKNAPRILEMTKELLDDREQ